jgi:hypothetical protein
LICNIYVVLIRNWIRRQNGRQEESIHLHAFDRDVHFGSFFCIRSRFMVYAASKHSIGSNYDWRGLGSDLQKIASWEISWLKVALTTVIESLIDVTVMFVLVWFANKTEFKLFKDHI